MAMYETIFIAQPAMPEEDAVALRGTFEEILREREGNLVKVDNWGKRKLAYPLRKNQEGYFFHFRYDAPPEALAEFERRLRNHEQILKYLSVRLDRRALNALEAAERKAAEKAALRAQKEAERAARQAELMAESPEGEAAPREPAAAPEPAVAPEPPSES